MSRKIITAIAVAMLASLFTVSGTFREETVMLPVLMYHHLDSVGNGDTVVSTDTFEAHLEWLCENGYESVTPDMLLAFVQEGVPLPEKPYLLTFDDGYESNLTLALPLLIKYGVNATVAIIGSSVGCDTYKNTGVPIIPHFDVDGARVMLNSGLVTLASHTWDMHTYAPLEMLPSREYAARLADESASDFADAFYADCLMMQNYMRDELGCELTAFAYPHGVWDETGEAVLCELGVPITLTTEPRTNQIRRGDKQSLRLLGRFTVNESTDIANIFTSNKPDGA